MYRVPRQDLHLILIGLASMLGSGVYACKGFMHARRSYGRRVFLVCWLSRFRVHRAVGFTVRPLVPGFGCKVKL